MALGRHPPHTPVPESEENGTMKDISYEIQKSRISVFNDSGRGRNSLSIGRSESPTSVFCLPKLAKARWNVPARYLAEWLGCVNTRQAGVYCLLAHWG
ncbi:hypothetical protein CDAR_618431 [Caerostris darwini]|uniref:Uncharacterized protein n=1 Tax=Caerostris darwini TaxID=1538125 RepID=A0AAV4ST14_9ARAC|nr:hypothetical protein CDAR_618431 [Caerostris darwini]